MSSSLDPIDERLDAIGHGSEATVPITDLERTGFSSDQLVDLWRALGRPDLSEAPRFTEADRRLVSTAAALAAGVAGRADPDLLKPVLRTIRAATHALRRVSDAHVTASLEVRVRQSRDLISDIDLHSDTFEHLLLELWRHELRQSVARALSTTDDPTQPLLVVGFVDLAGYSARSQQMTTDDLVELIDRFDTAAIEVTGRHEATIVKTIGDEVMFTHRRPTSAAMVALDLVEECANDDLMLAARAGLSWGRPLALAGDYYGPSVNIAARLVQLAKPNTALVDAGLAAQLDAVSGVLIGPMQPQQLRNCGTHAVHTLRRVRTHT